MKAYLLIILFFSSIASFSQTAKDSISAPKLIATSTALSKITITESYKVDSLDIKIECVVIEGKDAFEIQVMKYRGLTAEFHKPMGRTMLTRVLDATHTEIDIKTVFSGVFYLDIYNADKVKLKTFTIEKQF